MKGELVSFQTSDRLELPGILFEPVKRSKKIALFLHGNGSSSIFYSTERMNILAQELTKRGISFLPFNNRGAHYVKSFYIEKAGKDERVEYGMAFELIRECVKDIDAAVKFLDARGYEEFYLIGHSTGANKICAYNALKPRNIIAKYVLLAGGDDAGLFYKETGPKKFFSLLVQCEKMIKKGRGRDMVPGAGWISYQSLYDTINPDGEYNIFPFYETLHNVKLSKMKSLFKEFRSIKKPTLVLYGENDEFCYARVPECVDALKKACSALENFSFSTIKDADHGFHGKEKELARSVARWLSVPLFDGRPKEVRADSSGA